MDRSRARTRFAWNSPVSDCKSREWSRWMRGSIPLPKVSTRFYSREQKIEEEIDEKEVGILSLSLSRSSSPSVTKREFVRVSCAWKLAIFIIPSREREREREKERRRGRGKERKSGRKNQGAGFAENRSVKRNNEPRNKAGCVFFLSCVCVCVCARARAQHGSQIV